MNDTRESPRADGPRVPLAIEEALAAGAMAVICVISLANVVVRYLTDASFAFTEEISVFMLVFLAFFGSAVAFARDEQIRIRFFAERLGRSWRWLATVVTLAANLVVFTLVIGYGARFTYEEWLFGATTPGLGMPAWLYTMWLPIAGVVIIARVLGRFRRQLRSGQPD